MVEPSPFAWLRQLSPLEYLKNWYEVSETRMAEILEQVRLKLPTTEAFLLGKTQAGKSSIIRGMTGVSADIIGSGFRPHTRYIERYSYPNNELPLLIFTDTVGLGDVDQQTSEIIAEVVEALEENITAARIFILTVKINDFATDSLKQAAQALKKQYPNIPFLLAVTCLHECYPASLNNHPTSLADFPEIERAYQAILSNFQGLYDKSVLIDFTLEEDGYDPLFYGLEYLRNSLTELLPQAEAKAIYQLLNDVNQRDIGILYRDVARRYILTFSIVAGATEAVGLPFASMPLLTALQISMVTLLGKLYGQTLTLSQAGGIVSTIAGGFLAQAIGRELIKFIPGFGSAISASWAAAYTWALGEASCVYFGDLIGGKKPDPAKIQSVMRDAFTSFKKGENK
jgi:GTP-binding protein EngB required for normal cell division